MSEHTVPDHRGAAAGHVGPHAAAASEVAAQGSAVDPPRSNPAVAIALEFIQEGALDFIEKPLADSRILRSVSALLSL
jgi:hypothetical protein